MALEGNIETNFGINLNYHHISSYCLVKFMGTEDETILEATVRSFIDQAARDEGKQPVLTQIFTMPGNSKGLDLSQAYEELKKKEMFSNMKDV